jgi:nucleotide-binding universal stress UspA family protein
MAQRDYTPYQQKIIQRYYENRDQMDDQRLSELVAELYLAGAKKKAKLWQTARELMTRLGVPAGRVEHVVGSGDPAILAEVVRDLQAGRIVKPAKPPTDKPQ